MFMFDVETLGTESNSVLLSLACIYFDPKTKPTYQQLRESAFFVKFDVRDQVETYNRKIYSDAVKWWEKQSDIAKRESLLPSAVDRSMADGISLFHDWIKLMNDDKCIVWTRGSLDDIILHSVERQLKVDTLFAYNRFRDVRTAIDIFYNSTNGYCDVNHPEFMYERDVYKHDPVDDCAFDIMMLIYGEENASV